MSAERPIWRMEGPLVWLDTKSLDQRVLRGDGLTIPKGPLTAYWSSRMGETGVIGQFIAERRRNVVWGIGSTFLSPGRYGCGVDVSELEVETDGGVMTIVKATLAGLVIYGPEPESPVPAFPGSHVRVYEEPL